jgi:hypothetical protein
MYKGNKSALVPRYFQWEMDLTATRRFEAVTAEETFGWLLQPGRACRVLEAQIESEPSTLVLKVQESPELWPEQSARAGTSVVIHDQIRHVGRSQKPSPCPRTVQRDDWAGITRAAMPASGRDWLPTHPTG